MERGIEVVTSTLPALVTVHATAAKCRPRHAKQVMKHKYTPIQEWNADKIGGEDSSYGLSGSPTKVKKVENIVFQAKEAKKLTSSDADIDALIGELIANHTIG